MQTTTITSADRQRFLELDVIYLVTLASVIVSHLLFPFSDGQPLPPAHIKNAELSTTVRVVSLATGFNAITAFFVVAGWTTTLALDRRSARAYLVERFRRLLVPLMFGVLVFGPVLKYYELKSGFDFRLDGPRTWPNYDRDLIGHIVRVNTRYYLHTWGHLWFLAYLFAISVAALPIVLWLKRSAAARPPAGDDRPLAFYWAYLPILGGALILFAICGFWPFYPTFIYDLGRVAYFGYWFLIGTVVALEPRFEAVIRREWWRLALLCAAGFVAHELLYPHPVTSLLSAIAGWGGFAALLGVIALLKPKGGPVLAYLRDAGLVIYILHYVIMNVAGFYILQLDTSLWVKLALLSVVTIGGSLLLYQYVIRPVPPLRFVFGLRAA